MKSTASDKAARGRLAELIGASLVAIAALSVSSLAMASTTHAVKGVVITSSVNSKFGTILVSGTTLYTLTPSKTPCDASCTKVWPELLLPKGVTKATAGSGVSASKLGTVARAGASRPPTQARPSTVSSGTARRGR